MNDVRSEGAGSIRIGGFADSVCDCRGCDIGIDCPTVILPGRRISAEEYFSRFHANFSRAQMDRHWFDYAIEPERLFDFLQGQMDTHGLDHPVALCAETAGVLVSEATSSDLAVSAGQQLLQQRPGIASAIEGLIYYSASLNTRPAWSTPCRLHFELGLKCETAFMVAQKGANASYAALKVGVEIIQVEGIHQLLLVGSEQFAPPHSRVFSGLGVQSDSASAMLLGSGIGEFEVCCIVLQDSFERPPHPLHSTDEERLDFWSEAVLVILRRFLQIIDLRPGDVETIIAPNFGVPLLRRIAAKAGVPWEKFQVNAQHRFGFLGSSDIAANLQNLKQSALKSGDKILSFGLSSDGSVCGCVFNYEPQRRIE